MKKQKNRDMHNGLIKLMKKIQEELGDDGIGLPILIGDGPAPHIPVIIWKDLPDLPMQILEKVGYNHYNRLEDSVEFDQFCSFSLSIGSLKKWMKNLSNINSNNNISTKLWKQLPDHAIEVLETVGYTKYDRKTDSIVFVEK